MRRLRGWPMMSTDERGTDHRLCRAGKSAIAGVLARRGLACVDDDEDPFLARFAGSAGAVVAEEPAQPDFGWLFRHSREWNPARLDDLIRAGLLIFPFASCPLR